MSVNTDYALRIPELSEIRDAYGSLRRAWAITGGDLPLVMFYLHNPGLVAKAVEVNPRSELSSFAVTLRDAAKAENREVLAAQAAAAYSALEKPTINAVAARLRIGWSTAKKRLQAAGVRLAQ